MDVGSFAREPNATINEKKEFQLFYSVNLSLKWQYGIVIRKELVHPFFRHSPASSMLKL